MAVEFAGQAFHVETPDGLLPYITADAAGLVTYSATINILTYAGMEFLRTRRSLVTTYPSLGFAEAGIIVIEGGTGADDLTIPVDTGEATYVAVLIAFEAQSLMTTDEYYRASATWVIVGPAED